MVFLFTSSCDQFLGQIRTTFQATVCLNAAVTVSGYALDTVPPILFGPTDPPRPRRDFAEFDINKARAPEAPPFSRARGRRSTVNDLATARPRRRCFE